MKEWRVGIVEASKWELDCSSLLDAVADAGATNLAIDEGAVFVRIEGLEFVVSQNPVNSIHSIGS